ncbi:zinc transporter ZIP11 isoform X2 [Onthophagus taurus]|uniref:zinc transporter ZIP11 isoform X2 n=1 Tax=Onthophagus taurus TaxID=166361 RepID=UPI000C206254|nr:zinc transporter ZIP11 isoform X2 [Onthophagus taurus]
MLQGYGPVMQAFMGTLMTWGLTAAGASLVIFIKGTRRKFLDASLGFAAGVMIAASYWSLLSPAIEMAEKSQKYGENGEYAFIPVAIGFLLGAVFVFLADKLISKLGSHSHNMMLALHNSSTRKEESKRNSKISTVDSATVDFTETTVTTTFRRRVDSQTYEENIEEIQHGQWKRIMLLVVAITVHNIPEGLAVGVGFGAVGSSTSATFESARNLAIGIGIQNFPEGLAVSLPLHAAGFSTLRSFWYGQLSGMVEPIFGVLGALTVALAQPVLPYALAFAAGAMIYVVVDDIIPEANTNGNGKLATWGSILGFLVMMTLDVGLG